MCNIVFMISNNLKLAVRNTFPIKGIPIVIIAIYVMLILSLQLLFIDHSNWRYFVFIFSLIILIISSFYYHSNSSKIRRVAILKLYGANFLNIFICTIIEMSIYTLIAFTIFFVTVDMMRHVFIFLAIFKPKYSELLNLIMLLIAINALMSIPIGIVKSSYASPKHLRIR